MEQLASFQEMESKAARTLTRADYDRYLPLVRRIAMKLARSLPSTFAVADLVSCGWVGLLEAHGRASEDMPDDEFMAYASHRVRGAMLDYVRRVEPNVREARNASRRMARTIRTLTTNLRRTPTEDEVAKALDISVAEYQALLGKVSRAGMARLEIVDFDGEDVPTPDEAPDEAASKRMITAALAEAIPSLPPRLQTVVALYYQEDCTLKEIGAILGVTESRACQLHSEAIHRLRAAIGRE